MKLRKLSQVVLAAAVGIGSSFGLTSCVQSHTIGYFYVTGHQYNQVSAYKIDNNTGNLTQQGGPIGSGGVNPIDAIVTQGGKFLYVLNAGCADATAYPNAKYLCPSGTAATAGTCIAVHHRRRRRSYLPGQLLDAECHFAPGHHFDRQHRQLPLPA